MRKSPNAVWNQMSIEDRRIALEGGYLSECDKDYRTSPPEASFLRGNWQQIPAYKKEFLLKKWGYKS